jgi:hypothetical protein
MLFARRTLSYEDWIAVSQGASYVEFDWIGIDSTGQFGIFCSIGMGYIPRKVFSSFESYTGLNSLLYDHGKSPTAQIISKESGIKNFWRDWALRGLFAYDYYDVHRKEKLGRYDLIAIPGQPLLVSAFPEVYAFDEIIPRFRLTFSTDISFTQMMETEL